MRLSPVARVVVAAATCLVAALPVAGCSSGQASAWPEPGSATAAGDSTPSVCSRIRTAISGDMKPIGSSLGTLVGYVTAGDESGQAAATQQVQAQIKDLGADVQKAAAGAADSKLTSAVTAAVGNLNTLAADPTLLSSVSDVSAIPAISKKLDDATHPIAVACG